MPRDPAVVYKAMSSVRSENTTPELALRRELWKRGYRYRINYKKLPGKPDIVFTRKKIAIFCDGDYWHGHNWALRGIPSLKEELDAYTPYWRKKILRNIERDKRITAQLLDMGWTVIRLWESDIKTDMAKCLELVCSALSSNDSMLMALSHSAASK